MSQYRAQGSYLYPPILHSTLEAIAFWESVEIPDKVCDEVARQYDTQWQAVIDFLPLQMWQHAVRAEREADGEDVSEEAHQQFVDEWRAKLTVRPTVLDPRDVRAAAKVIGLVSAKKALPEAERHHIDDHQVETTDGYTSVRDYNLGMGLAFFGATVTDPATYRTDVMGELAQIRILLEQVNTNVDTTREDLDGVVRYVGQQLVDMIAATAR
jgi:hypothetical protein